MIELYQFLFKFSSYQQISIQFTVKLAFNLFVCLINKYYQQEPLNCKNRQFQTKQFPTGSKSTLLIFNQTRILIDEFSRYNQIYIQHNQLQQPINHSMFNFIGKFLIAISLCFQAFVLYSDPVLALNFDKQAVDLVKSSQNLNYQSIAYLIPHIRLLTCGLLVLSALMVFFKYSLIKFFVLLGLIINLIVIYNPFKKIPGLSNTGFWQEVAIIGGIIYLMGADVGKPVVAQPVRQQKQVDQKKQNEQGKKKKKPKAQ